MTTLINADTVVGGAVITGDGSGELGLQAAGVTKLTVTSTGVTLATPLPVASGGTGSTSSTFVNLTSNVTGTLPVANGGTGATTLAANNVLLGNGTSALQAIAPSTSGNVLTSNGTTWSSSAPTFGNKSFIATGNLSSGQTVALRTDGTVEGIYAANATYSNNGPQAIVSTVPQTFFGSAIDPINGKIVNFYGVNAAGGSAIVSTLSGTTIVSGTANTIVSGLEITSGAVCFDSTNNVFVFVYRQASNNNNYVVVGSVSGTTITLGTPVLISTSATQDNTGTSITFDSVNSKVVITYSNGATPAGFAVVGTVSGTSITLGTPVQYAAASTYVSSCFDQYNGKIAISYYSAGTVISAIVGTVSGTSISFGTAVSLRTSATASCYTACAYDPINRKVGFGYKASAYYANAGVVSGTSISFETEVQFDAGTTGIGVFSAAYDYAAQQVIFTNVITTAVYAKWVSFAKTTAVLAPDFLGVTGGANNSRVNVSYDYISKQSVIVFKSNSTTFVVGFTNKQVYQSNSTNFFGITEAAISNGASGNITVLGGINSVQTGLLTESSYFVNTSGALTATPTSSTVYAGLALSPTSIQLGSTITSSPNSRNTGMVLLSTATVSTVTSITFDDYFTSAYKNYMFVWSDVKSSGLAQDLQAQLKFSGSYVTATASYAYGTVRVGTSTYTGTSGTATSLLLGINSVPASTDTLMGGGYLYLFNPLEATRQKTITGSAASSTANQANAYIFSGTCTGTGATTACQGLKFLSSGATFITGTFALYGITS